MKKALYLSAIIFGIYMLKRSSKPNLNYFNESEFYGFYPLLSNDLLFKLDEFRNRWGAPVRVSPATGAIVRFNGTGDESQHNVDMWGESRAIDVFPEGMEAAEDRARAYQIAKDVGFTGIGIYTDTKPGNMIHVDVRKGTHVATWSRVGYQYLGIDEVLA
ncbi:hypothetical protein [Oceanobacter sp. 3_MG-2023]|uniref:hypothetical protein n=1 Tax=Oceanobacter sp. 3_MG-2023 TaxID=3062622 RepID=UPI002732680C|nr:hypothetical protein [Oceanobacter sp. 3_MG-2023]MDP2505646.1 hypothetical protein [Oceanobacter sp. 3_MG-2023]